MITRKSAALLCCLALGVLAPLQISRADEPAPQKEEEVVQSQLKEMVAALYKGDVDTVLKYTHPMVLGALGGHDIAAKLVKSTLDKLLADGLELEEFTFPAPPTFLKATEHEFVIVPTKTIIDVNGTRMQSLSYQFEARAVGETGWLYIDGTKVNRKNVAKFFSDFPKDYEFPEIERTVVE